MHYLQAKLRDRVVYWEAERDNWATLVLELRGTLEAVQVLLVQDLVRPPGAARQRYPTLLYEAHSVQILGHRDQGVFYIRVQYSES